MKLRVEFCRRASGCGLPNDPSISDPLAVVLVPVVMGVTGGLEWLKVWRNRLLCCGNGAKIEAATV